MAESEYMTMEQFAAEVHVNIDTARRWVREGRIGDVRRVGKRYLIPRATVKSFIESSVYTPPRKPPASADADQEETQRKLNRTGD